MPAISLVVCVYQEKDLVERLLRKTVGCYNDLVVVHDGPDIEGIRQLVEKNGGKFFEQPRQYQQEPHWPFAWQQAQHDWILKLDADEFPSDDLKNWIQSFRNLPEPIESISGYACLWPLWNGQRATTHHWPDDRIFLFNRQRVKFFGMVEQGIIPDGEIKKIPLVLHHQPKRKSYGIRNTLFRSQAYDWRRAIAKSLLGKPTDLPCWRWTSNEWPQQWRELIDHPLQTAFFRLIWFPLMQVRSMIKHRETPKLSACLNPAIHHFLLGWTIWRMKKEKP